MVEQLKILIVEDNPAHFRILQYVFQKNNINANVVHAKDGQEAINLLIEESQNHSITKPNLILLDLNLPKKDGREVLKIIKEDQKLKDIPVVIVSTSDREEDISYAKNYGAVAYISKSSGFENFNKQLSQITRYAKL